MKNSDIQLSLKKNGLLWFIDSGSLLGMIREGHFLTNDDDIDIGVIDNTGDIEAFVKEMEENGFRAVKFKWGKTVYKIKLIPDDESVYSHILDVQLYKKRDDYYVCPQVAFKKNLGTIGKIRQKLIRIKKSAGRRGGKKKAGKLTALFLRKESTIQNRYQKSIYDYYLWRIPTKYPAELTEKEGFNVFRDAESYLEYRYGDWRTPVTEWSFTRDDKAIVKVTHKEINGLYSEK